MKFKINKNEFLKGLLQVGKIIPIKHTNYLFASSYFTVKKHCQ